ncbi:hypothetical protein [Cupriavidus sp. AcVe19-6a]|uniref:hypothetical protein n=1 Tax=Cupriavidus sp. AcVe19-6a TaxID=2821358 RepID=UPI001AE76C87|nr:hypothetical protein [Cupriavidus sp. AcVe19-6a]MBP0634879.1 hypothetical protein [Cupriavidus sp. AcVe19-6a]
MITFKQTRVKLSSVNARMEFHGDTEVLMKDLKLEATLPNTVLDQVSPDLRSSLYKVSGSPQQALPDTDLDHLTDLKHPNVGGYKANDELEGILRIHVSNRKTDDLVFPEAKFSKFAIAPQEGGTVKVVMMVAVQPSEANTGWLDLMIHKEFKITSEYQDRDDDDSGQPEQDE